MWEVLLSEALFHCSRYLLYLIITHLPGEIPNSNTLDHLAFEEDLGHVGGTTE